MNVVSVALGSKSNLNVVVDRVSALDENRTEVLLHVQERSATGAVHKAPAIELSSFLWQPNSGARQQLTCMGVTSCVPKMRPSLEQLREYLSTPPAGIDVRLWKQAQAENPVPDQFIPIPLVGFGDLVRHLHLQVIIYVFDLCGVLPKVTRAEWALAPLGVRKTPYSLSAVSYQRSRWPNGH